MNRKFQIANEKGNHMNYPNKVNLILLIAQRFTEEMCANVLERYNNHPLLIANKLANEAINWNEDLHPRHNDGKFAPKGQGEEGRYTRDQQDKTLQEIDDVADEAKKARAMRGGKGFTASEYTLRDIADMIKADEGAGRPGKHNMSLDDLLAFFQEGRNNEARPTRGMQKMMELLERLKKFQSMDGSAKNNATIHHSENEKRYKKFKAVDSKLDEILDKYGSAELDSKSKSTDTAELKAARKEYRKLVRQRAKLEKQIDWKNLDDDELDELADNIESPAKTVSSAPSPTQKKVSISDLLAPAEQSNNPNNRTIEQSDDDEPGLEDDNYEPDDDPSRHQTQETMKRARAFLEKVRSVKASDWPEEWKTEYRKLWGSSPIGFEQKRKALYKQVLGE